MMGLLSAPRVKGGCGASEVQLRKRRGGSAVKRSCVRVVAAALFVKSSFVAVVKVRRVLFLVMVGCEEKGEQGAKEEGARQIM